MNDDQFAQHMDALKDIIDLLQGVSRSQEAIDRVKAKRKK